LLGECRKYCEEAPKLAIQACKKAVEDWGGSPADITHIISVSCTGGLVGRSSPLPPLFTHSPPAPVQAPGIEFFVMEELGIPRTAERLGINLMGCFGAFRALATAKALGALSLVRKSRAATISLINYPSAAKEDPKNRILIVCTELCTLHFQSSYLPTRSYLAFPISYPPTFTVVVAELCLETFVSNILFGDGSSSLVVGAQPSAQEKALWVIERSASRILEHTPQLMTWEASDHGS